VDTVASHFHVSRATLQRRVRAQFGCGILHLQHKLKLEDAAKRLVESDVSASECADLYGYSDVFHFTKSFKQMFRQPPIRYRNDKIRHRLTLSG
jgi:AraC-like DNA-binding protein